MIWGKKPFDNAVYHHCSYVGNYMCSVLHRLHIGAQEVSILSIFKPANDHFTNINSLWSQRQAHRTDDGANGGGGKLTRGGG